jgi:hypothetical protein
MPILLPGVDVVEFQARTLMALCANTFDAKDLPPLPGWLGRFVVSI